MATFLQYWQTLADELGDWMTFAATSTSVSGTATSEIIASSLIDSSVASDRYAHHFVYALDGALAGQQRLVTRSGFGASTGTLTVSRAFGSAPQSGVNWALTRRFPVIRQDKQPGLRDFINRGLRDLSVRDFITISAIAQNVTYPLPTSTNWWLLAPGSVVGLRKSPADATERHSSEENIASIYMDGETPILELCQPYNTGETFQLEVLRPANSRLKIGGAWGDQSSPTAGLTLDAEEALPPVHAVVQTALVYAYQSIISEPGLADARQYWEAKLRQQKGRASVAALRSRAPVPVVQYRFPRGNVESFR